MSQEPNTNTPLDAEQPQPSSLLSGVPARAPKMDFGKYARGLVAKLLGVNPPQMTMGIFGGYGVGKSTLMKDMARKLEATPKEEWGPEEVFGRELVVVWFDAWRYSHVDHLFVPLLWTIAAHDKIATQPKLRTILFHTAQCFLRGVTLSAGPVKLDYDKVFVAQKEVMEEDRPDLRKLIGDYVDVPNCLKELTLGKASKPDGGGPDGHRLSWRLRVRTWLARGAGRVVGPERRIAKWLTKRRDRLAEKESPPMGALKDDDRLLERRIVVFVDDLDRCMPEEAFKLLEGIKALADIRGFLFVLGLDPKVVGKFLKVKYKDLKNDPPVEAEDYLEKMFQVGFRVPAPEGDDFDTVLALFEKDGPADIAVLLGARKKFFPKPITVRKIKRLANDLIGICAAASYLEKSIVLDLLILKVTWPGIYDVVVEHKESILFGLRQIIDPPLLPSESDAAETKPAEAAKEGDLVNVAISAMSDLLFAEFYAVMDKDLDKLPDGLTGIRPYLKLTSTREEKTHPLAVVESNQRRREEDAIRPDREVLQRPEPRGDRGILS